MPLSSSILIFIDFHVSSFAFLLCLWISSRLSPLFGLLFLPSLHNIIWQKPEDSSGGLFTEGSLVVARGNLVEGVFQVNALALPPHESQKTTKNTFPGTIRLLFVFLSIACFCQVV